MYSEVLVVWKKKGLCAAFFVNYIHVSRAWVTLVQTENQTSYHAYMTI